MAEPVVRFLRVSKSFGRARVLRGLELDIRPGEFLGLAGINGAGKTTLLKCLLDFCDLDEGEIRVHGISHHRPESRSQLAFLPERFTPPYFLTGREFVRTMLRLGSRSFDEARLRAMFDALDLDLSALDKPVRTYSKGMTQKLGLAACFLSDRELYVLDEPMSDLDPKARACVKELLLAMKGQGRTLLFTSHMLADIDEICDHMAILNRGTFAYTGPPLRLRERYAGASLESAFLQCIEAYA